jgi:Zn-dependent peptidase ImmA (M78 family)
MRRTVQLSPLTALDALLLAQDMGVKVLTPQDVAHLPGEILAQLLRGDSDGWSAGCLRLPDGKAVIICNPNHALTRRRATIMEELAHLHLRHKGSQLINERDGTSFRSYKKSEETAAYWVGAAALLPKVAIQRAKREGVSKSLLAAQFGVSQDLVEFRQRVTKVRLS